MFAVAVRCSASKPASSSSFAFRWTCHFYRACKPNLSSSRPSAAVDTLQTGQVSIHPVIRQPFAFCQGPQQAVRFG